MIAIIHRDFVEVKAAGYSPGILWTGSNRFILSVSIPTPGLFQHISAHALLAWDRHFLEPGLYFTLLISGFHDVYPALRQDGTLAPDFLRDGSTLKFKVGFTRQYKPSWKNAVSFFREFSLQHTNNNAEEDSSLDLDTMDIANHPDSGA